MSRGVLGLVELPVYVDEALQRRIDSLARQIGGPAAVVVRLAMIYGLLDPFEGDMPSGRRMVRVSVSREFHQALRQMRIRTPAERGLVVLRGMSGVEEHLEHLQGGAKQ